MSDDQSHLSQDFYARDTVLVARELLGCHLWTSRKEGKTVGRIVETEAYRDDTDLASHAARFKRGRVLSMHGQAGICYVYQAYGIHVMLNVVAKWDGDTGAVLIRAVEPLLGVDIMERRRGVTICRELCSGPGKLTQAMGITLDDHGVFLVNDEQNGIELGVPPTTVGESARIGISRGTEHVWRFFDADSPFISRVTAEATGPSPQIN